MTPESAAASLEQRLERLDAIVTQLEREGVELEDALALFEEGVAHLRAAEQTIRSAELRMERLLERAGGEPGTERMEPMEPPAP